jgi:hypothetical protein
VIARVADSAVGLAAPCDGDRVRIPLGLVALYWIRMFKPLLQAGLPQTPTNKALEGLGFVRDGFRAILHVPAQDLRIGASLWGSDAGAINQAVSDAARLIARKPAFYTTYADGQPVFPVRTRRTPAVGDRLIVDAEWLWRFGDLEVPRHVWNAVRHLNVWIEPIIVGEWASLMQSYGERQGRTLSMDELHRELAWLDPARDTRVARSIADDLMSSASRCSASGPASDSTSGASMSTTASPGWRGRAATSGTCCRRHGR